MKAYTDFAEVYDMFMDNIPYEEWCGYLTSLLAEYGVSDGIVLDLGCGTGTLTELLARHGYDMIGVDISGEMLQEAMEKREISGLPILYLCQDMREFELYGTVRAIVSLCDSMNYMLETGDLVQVFSLVNNYLDPGGIFIFDLNMDHKFRMVGNSTIAEEREEGSFIWENDYDEAAHINEYTVTLFIREEDGRYRRSQEIHYERAYSLEEIREALAAAGMEFVAAYDAFTKNPPQIDSDRICVVAREHGKETETA